MSKKDRAEKQLKKQLRKDVKEFWCWLEKWLCNGWLASLKENPVPYSIDGSAENDH